MQNEKRFVCVDRRSGVRTAEIWVDTRTGVNYLFVREGFAGGLSPLLDTNGKPVISEEYIHKD